MKTKLTFRHFLVIAAISIICTVIHDVHYKMTTVDYYSTAVYVMERGTRREIIKKNEEMILAPASLTKMATVIVALQDIPDLSKTTRIDKESYLDLVNRNASMAGFYGEEPVTYRDLLYGTMLASGGECARTLAVRTQGTEKEFVERMNEFVQNIGLKNTHFMNSEGLDVKNQYTTAKDVAYLIDVCLENGHFEKLFTTKEFQTSRTVNHPNGILLKSTVLTKVEKHPDFTIIGGKSGTTTAAGYCWATLIEKNGRQYIAVVMKAPLKEVDGKLPQWIDTMKIGEKIY